MRNTSQVGPTDTPLENCTLSMILQVNDKYGVESLKSLLDPVMPSNIIFLSSYYDLVNYNFQKVQAIKDVTFYARIFRLKMFPNGMDVVDGGVSNMSSSMVVNRTITSGRGKTGGS